ncbi:serine/threonine protein kinase [Calothrix sp. PCC 6303]|uniref:serine/threonine protein kinase n=1 Tax=Calothrix sp. PCC 6303 TaxID=1170562 RepID=UPI0002A0188E|nr:serine/threonine-protein kinase [Calothrix sp. PCC 6303]AFZ02264.1 serine/threonine protein kinase [Calothrix sp. PCC 6303]
MEELTDISSQEGELISNRYQLKQLIATGGMGEIFLAHDILLGGTPVAIKFLSGMISDSKMQADFAHEARTCAILSQRSIHIVKVTDYGISNAGKLYYIMEYLEGKTLSDLLPLSLPTFLNITFQICLGLQCAHEGINIDGKISPLVHRDIKPANILVVSDLILGQLVKILDFGIAKFSHNPTLIKTHQDVCGTLPYCSPEQLENQELDCRSDIYSLGVLMFEMLTDHKPWKPDTDYLGAWYTAHHFQSPRTITSVSPNLQIPQELNQLIMACLAKNPQDRPQRIGELIAVIQDLKNSAMKLPSLYTQAAKSSPNIINKYSLANTGLSKTIEKACWQLPWSKDKPIRQIVFPLHLNTENGKITALSLMMSKSEIEKYVTSTHYNEFAFIAAPYPTLLWVTLLYSREYGKKWLPCYLDMQNSQHLKLVGSLAECDRYPLICYTQEPPHDCLTVLAATISLQQRQMLKTWLQQSQTLPSAPAGNFQLSKNLLKQHYKEIQSRVMSQFVDKILYASSQS